MRFLNDMLTTTKHEYTLKTAGMQSFFVPILSPSVNTDHGSSLHHHIFTSIQLFEPSQIHIALQ